MVSNSFNLLKGPILEGPILEGPILSTCFANAQANLTQGPQDVGAFSAHPLISPGCSGKRKAASHFTAHGFPVPGKPR